MLKEGLGLNGRFGLDGGADQIVCRLDVFIRPMLAKGFDGRLHRGEIRMGGMRGFPNDEDGIQRGENARISTRIVTGCFTGGR